MTRLWRRSLAAQFIFFMLLALALSQGIGFLTSWNARDQALRLAAKGEFLSRTGSLALLLESTPPELAPEILRVSDTAYTRFWISPDAPPDVPAWRATALGHLATPLPSVKQLHGKPVDQPPAPPAALPAGPAPDGAWADWRELPPQAWPLSRAAKFIYLDQAYGMGLAVRLENGAWLNAVYAKSVQNALWTPQSATSLAITALVLSVIAVIVARSVARPLRRLAAAAELLGRGETVEPLPETGPDDIRQTAEAFNRMQARLQRFVEDRTRMLAAIGHDLRTPLTSLRLRAEFVADPDVQEKMLKTIDEIQTMTEAALAFAREEATAERTRTVDLTALVESLCDDLADLGQDVTFLDSPRFSYRCRPDALRRSVRNLVENAVRYGERARVRIVKAADSIDIVVADDGPGIPDAHAERAFAPFFRLEHSRNRETGGVGLGLSIARTIARHHGGDITLATRPDGMTATISLPLASLAPQPPASQEPHPALASAARAMQPVRHAPGHLPTESNPS
ncbi:sensor histidine kinase [Geminicoccus harenae]|uniref:sensor histidine kinase n=2 Tax=Geminicoccus harenae TaxID=2498453 RepID=UPI001C9592B5|nr:HAMP domain-containing sensor histidine kinase [Geminicoccus harenae]